MTFFRRGGKARKIFLFFICLIFFQIFLALETALTFLVIQEILPKNISTMVLDLFLMVGMMVSSYYLIRACGHAFFDKLYKKISGDTT